MEDFHPATCTQCCKRLIDNRRKWPELIEETLYLIGQAGFLLLIAAGTLAIAPMMFMSWIMGSDKKSKQPTFGSDGRL